MTAVLSKRKNILPISPFGKCELATHDALFCRLRSPGLASGGLGEEGLVFFSEKKKHLMIIFHFENNLLDKCCWDL